MPSDYYKTLSTFWTGETGRAIRGDADAQRVAFYLFSNGSANMIGLYQLALPTLMHEIGISRERALKALARLSEAGFATYDEQSESVFVPNMAPIQMGARMTETDKRVKNVAKLYNQMRKCPFAKDFWDLHAKTYHLKCEAPPKPLASPLQAPPKPSTAASASSAASASASAPTAKVDHKFEIFKLSWAESEGSAVLERCSYWFSRPPHGIFPQPKKLSPEDRAFTMKLAALVHLGRCSEGWLVSAIEGVKTHDDSPENGGPIRNTAAYLTAELKRSLEESCERLTGGLGGLLALIPDPPRSLTHTPENSDEGT